MKTSNSVRDQIFFVIRENPGILRTEVRDKLNLQNNISGPAIKELIDKGMVLEGELRVSSTTGKKGRALFVADDWAKEMNCQNRIFD
jgi:predicted transcriptional regulator